MSDKTQLQMKKNIQIACIAFQLYLRLKYLYQVGLE